MRKLSNQAESALLAAQGRTGAKVPTLVPGDRADLVSAGLVTEGGYLTARGQRQRQALARQREDEAFGG